MIKFIKNWWNNTPKLLSSRDKNILELELQRRLQTELLGKRGDYQNDYQEVNDRLLIVNKRIENLRKVIG